MVANEGRVRKMSPADVIMIVLPGKNAKIVCKPLHMTPNIPVLFTPKQSGVIQ